MVIAPDQGFSRASHRNVVVVNGESENGGQDVGAETCSTTDSRESSMEILIESILGCSC